MKLEVVGKTRNSPNGSVATAGGFKKRSVTHGLNIVQPSVKKRLMSTTVYSSGQGA